MSDSVQPHPWDSPGKDTGVGCHFLLQCRKVKVKSLSPIRLFATPWTAAHQAPPSPGFSRQEHWSGLPFPSPMQKSESEVAQSSPSLSDPMDCSLPGSFVHGIFQARVLDWGAIAFSALMAFNIFSWTSWSLVYFRCTPLPSGFIRDMNCKIFLPSCGLSSHFFKECSLKKFFNFWVDQLLFFFGCLCCLASVWNFLQVKKNIAPYFYTSDFKSCCKIKWSAVNYIMGRGI